jgi:hypothetical protein
MQLLPSAIVVAIAPHIVGARPIAPGIVGSGRVQGQFHVAESIVMPVNSERPNLLIGKLGGLIFVALGFLLAASGYRAGSAGYIAAGVVLIAIGVALLVRKIVRRNQ